ncbi:MAG: helix-turn-helix transcriptional regulator [Deltaproteobacteria bacterium]|nr:helix-turn-helix transcriptional regulator [Deltaproteobacteria bacterium]
MTIVLDELTRQPGVDGAILVTLRGQPDEDVHLGARWSAGVIPLHVGRWLRDPTTLSRRGWTATEFVPLDRPSARRLAFGGIESEVLAGLIGHDEGVIGWLAAFPGTRANRRAQQDAWERARDGILRTLSAASPLPQESATVIVCPEEGPQWGCASSPPWLALPELPAELCRLANEFLLDGDDDRTTHTGLATARLTRLSSGRGSQVLFELTPAQPLPPPLQSLLSPRQLQVAGYLEVGATLEEIASTLNIGRETVRTHAKAIYQRLDVSTRLDLSRLLQPVWPHR